MNERIQNFINRAKREDANVNPYGAQDMDRVMEKLAELIIEECCKIMSEYSYRPAGVVKRNVKEYFGVEE